MADSALTTAVIHVPANHTSGQTWKCYVVLHDIECPPGIGWAVALASGYMQNPATLASINYIVDAADIVETASEDTWVWGSGTPSSKHGIHIEQAGYASFTRAQWFGMESAIGSTYVRPNGQTYTYTAQDAADMAAQFILVAKLWADICSRHGWRPNFATEAAQLRAEVDGADLGLHVTHKMCRDWVGGTFHHDPEDAYPLAALVALSHTFMDGPIPPTPPPTPPTPDDIWEHIMALPDAPKTWKQAKRELATEIALMLTTYDNIDPATNKPNPKIPKTVERATQVSANRFGHGQNYDGSKVTK